MYFKISHVLTIKYVLTSKETRKLQLNIRIKIGTYLFFADAKKCFDKPWLKYCLIEMYNLGIAQVRLEVYMK